MERLPQEIVAKVAEYLPQEHEGKRIRPTLATLSRSWQYAIEFFTFEDLVITSDELQYFCAAFASHPTRRRFVRRILFAIILPTYSDEDCATHETAGDRAANSLAFSCHLSALLQELSQWPAEGNLTLKIEMYSPKDNAPRDPTKFHHDRNEAAMGGLEDLFSERYSYSYISLTRPLTAVVPRVTAFRVSMPGERKLDASSSVALTAAFPNLKHTIWAIYNPTYFVALQRQQMNEFARAVTSFQPPPACEVLHVAIRSSWYPHKHRLPNLNVDGNSICSSLCALLGRGSIRRLHYQGPIDPTLFWPRGTDKTPPSWGSLETLCIKFGPGSLEGQWFFKGSQADSWYNESSDVPLPQDAAGFFPPGYYDSDEQNEEAKRNARRMEIHHTFGEAFTPMGSMLRRAPRYEAILPLIKAVARRLAHTPSLQSVQLESYPRLHRRKWFLSYHAPGQRSRWDRYVDCSCQESACGNPVLLRARVFLRADDPGPYEEVAALLRGIGRAWNGEDAIVTFVPFPR